MMPAERSVLLVSRHYWPHMSDATLRVASLGAGLRELGRKTTVLTARGDRSWPKRIRMEKLVVHRVDGSPWNPLRRARHCRSMVQWIGERSEKWELVYFDEAGLEAAHALSSGAIQAPIIVRYDLAHLSNGQADWRPPRQILDVCRKAHAILVPDAASEQSLVAAGIIGTPIGRISDWHPLSIDRTIGARREARRILGETNNELRCRATDRIVLCPGELTDRWHIDALIRSLSSHLERHRHLRLWLLGDGGGRTRLYDQLKYLGLQYSVTLPGVFTDLELPFQAADLCVFPSRSCGWSALVSTCVQNEIPLLMRDCSRSRLISAEQAEQLTYSPSGVPLDQHIASWLTDSSSVAHAVLARKSYAMSRTSNADAEKLLAYARDSLSKP